MTWKSKAETYRRDLSTRTPHCILSLEANSRGGVKSDSQATHDRRSEERGINVLRIEGGLGRNRRDHAV